MNYPKTNLAAAVATVLALAGCGTAVEQDKGEGVAESFNARIVDGYLAGALVYVDSNDNGVLDAWEERAFTDRDGFVSVSDKGFNYCADGVKETDAVHCLKVRPSDSVKIRARGGYDRSTGEPFNGALSLKTTLAAGMDSANPVVASPLTTLLAGMDAAQKQAVADAIGVPPAALGTDFIKIATDATTTSDQRKALAAAMQVHKLIEVMSYYLTDAYDGEGSSYSGLGKNNDLPRDASEFIYEAFTEAVASNGGSVSSVATSASILGNTVIPAAQTKIKARIAKVTTKQVADIPGETALVDKLGTRVAKLANLGTMTGTLFAGAEIDAKKVAARLRAINIVVAVARDKDVSDIRVQEAIDAGAEAAFLSNLESPKVDVANLVKKFKAGNAAEAKTTDFKDRVAVKDALKIPDAIGSNTKLDLSDKDKGNLGMTFTTTDVVDGVATGGSLALDLKDFKDKGTLAPSEGNTAPVNVPGTWEKLDDYSLLVTIEPVPGIKQQAVVKPTLVVDPDTGKEVTKYFFDYGGKQREWKGPVPQ